jgi:hypothetical protein
MVAHICGPSSAGSVSRRITVSGHLRPVSLASREAEIRWVTVQGQAGGRVKNVHKTPSQQRRLGMMAHTCHSSYGRKCKIEGWQYSCPEEKVRPYVQRRKGRKHDSSNRVCAYQPSRKLS